MESSTSRFIMFKSSLAAFCVSCSCHGLSNICEARRWGSRLFWVVIFLASLVVVIIESYNAIDLYYQWQMNINLRAYSQREITFPTVTLCTNYFIKKNKYEELLKQLQGDDEAALYLSTTNSTQRKSLNIRAHAVKVTSSFQRYMTELTPEERQELMIEFDHFFSNCAFRSQYNCNSFHNFTKVYNSDFGICYAFGHLSNRQVTYGAGINQGLTVDINASFITDNYVAPWFKANPKLGFPIITIHVTEPDRVPYHITDKLNVIPMHGYNLVSVEKREIWRLPAPFSTDCVRNNSSEAEERDAYISLIPGGVYSVAGCQHTCLKLEQIRFCNCSFESTVGDEDFLQAVPFHSLLKSSYINSTYAFHAYFFPDRNFSYPIMQCAAPTSFQGECLLEKWKEQLTHGDSICHCPLPCDEWQHEIRIQHADPPLGVESDEASLSVYLAASDVYVTEYRQAYYWENLLGDLGGLLGLFMGLSAMFLAEMLELLVTLMNILLKIQPTSK